jgi:hypothetical protein
MIDLSPGSSRQFFDGHRDGLAIYDRRGKESARPIGKILGAWGEVVYQSTMTPEAGRALRTSVPRSSFPLVRRRRG